MSECMCRCAKILARKMCPSFEMKSNNNWATTTDFPFQLIRTISFILPSPNIKGIPNTKNYYIYTYLTDIRQFILSIKTWCDKTNKYMRWSQSVLSTCFRFFFFYFDFFLFVLFLHSLQATHK